MFRSRSRNLSIKLVDLSRYLGYCNRFCVIFTCVYILVHYKFGQLVRTCPLPCPVQLISLACVWFATCSEQKINERKWNIAKVHLYVQIGIHHMGNPVLFHTNIMQWVNLPWEISLWNNHSLTWTCIFSFSRGVQYLLLSSWTETTSCNAITTVFSWLIDI